MKIQQARELSFAGSSRLVLTAANPAPPGAIVTRVRTEDGLHLRVARWHPDRPAADPSAVKGTVVICGGRAEFIEKYFEVAAELLDRDFAVVILDWRGQGSSDRELANARKGHVDDFSMYERDLAALHRQVLEGFCPKPWFALGHSMGGAILIACARWGRCPFERLVLTAPMIDLHGLRHPRATRLLIEALDLAGFGGAFVPGGGARPYPTMPFSDNLLTSDLARYARIGDTLAKAPEMGIGAPTISWLNAAFRLMKQFADPEYPRLTLAPTLVIAAGADRIVDTPATERFATRLKAGRLLVLPYSRHEIMMERDVFREVFWAAFDAFIPGTRAEQKALETGPCLTGEPAQSGDEPDSGEAASFNPATARLPLRVFAGRPLRQLLRHWRDPRHSKS